MINPLKFWTPYRNELVSTVGRPPTWSSTAWTDWTCKAARVACEELGLDPHCPFLIIDVVGLRSKARQPQERLWGVAYEHEGGQDSKKNWTEELRKLWLIEADLRVLIGYRLKSQAPADIQPRLQDEIEKLRAKWPGGFGTNWLFAFGQGVGGDLTLPWNLWTLSEGGMLVVVEDATPFRPECDLRPS